MAQSRAKRATIADRRARLVQFRLEGRRYDDIYEELGYSSPSAASKDFNRALEQNIAEQRASMEVYRELEILRLDAELQRLDRLYTKVEKILDKFHVTVQFGKVIELDGQPLEDDSPVLAAADRLVRIDDARRRNAERRAKLLGLDKPQQIEVLTIDAIDAQIAELTDKLAAADAEAAEVEAAEGTPD